jgi:6-phosphogluconolactonase
MRIALIVGLGAAWYLTQLSSLSAEDGAIRFYIGTAVNADRGGIFESTLTPETGALSAPKLVAPTDRSTFIHLHPSLAVLYSVAELNDGEQGKGAGVLAWKIDDKSGSLTEISRQPAGGEGACHVTVREDGKYVAIANYGSGSISLYPLMKDGRIEAASANIQHQGSGPDKGRQTAPHAHSVQFDASGNRLLAADLGTDDIFVYDIQSNGTLQPSSPPSLKMPPGSGPRHFAFSPDHRFLLGLGEMSGTISTFAFDKPNASPLSTVSTMAEGTPADAERSCAEILFHPSLPVVYCSNRGPHEIAVFDFDKATGKLTRRSALACGGKVPRNFRLTPDGRFLLVANQGSNNVAVLAVDQKTGDLSATEHSIEVPSPMCIKFVSSSSN